MLENIACIKQCPAYAVLYFFPTMPVIFIRPIKYLRKHKISHKHKCTLSSTYMIFCCCFYFWQVQILEYVQWVHLLSHIKRLHICSLHWMYLRIGDHILIPYLNYVISACLEFKIFTVYFSVFDNATNRFCNIWLKTCYQWLISIFNRPIAKYYVNIRNILWIYFEYILWVYR